MHKHSRSLVGLRSLYPIDTPQPGASKQIAPFLSDFIQLTQPVPGRVRMEQQTQPAAAAVFNLQVPSGELWRVFGITCRLATDANAANRRLRFQYNAPGGLLVALMASETLQIANQTILYFSDERGFLPAPVAAAQIWIPLAPGWLLPSGSQVGIGIVNVQAGDQLSVIHVAREILPHPETSP